MEAPAPAGALPLSLGPNLWHTGVMPAFALTIFIGAFLLFQVQPLIGKYILPWFGGGPGVWTACLLFFQGLLLGGYAYAHLLTRWCRIRGQVIVHLALLAGALALLPIIPADSWKPRGGGNPTAQILALLAVCLGLPYFVLSATGPLLQHWFSRARPGAAPYRLYALSNLGSLLALISYPFYFETHFTRRAQAGLWGWGLAAYAVGCAACAWQLWKAEGTSSSDVDRDEGPRSATASPSSPSTPWRVKLLWLLLPCCASVLLLATTNKLCLDVAVIPFLWILPLGLYLLSFIICFDSPRWYQRFPFALALVAAAGGICWALFKASDWPLGWQIAMYSGGLFICCMVCHGELYRLRPAPAGLTGFYLMIAAGGALGGLFVALGAPALFTDYYELHWGLLLCAALLLIVCVAWPGTESRWLACTLPLAVFAGLDWFLARLAQHSPAVPKVYFWSVRAGMWGVLALMVISWIARKRFATFQHWRLLAGLWLALGVAALGATLGLQARKGGDERVFTVRNFYGVLTLYEHRKDEPNGHHLLLQHGRITHGLQFVDPELARWPTTYYGEQSGVGLALRALRATGRRIGVVGLGTGSITVYAKTNDYVRIYEINPEVQRLALSRFTYLSNCAGKVEIVLGDARLSMEREPPQRFDLLALDAFSSDAIPVHLLTQEAFELYERHLQTNGIIAVHISNHYLDLEPVVASLARRLHYRLAVIDQDENDEDWWLYASTWVLLTRDPEFLKCAPLLAAASPAKTNLNTNLLWTDDFVSLVPILH